MLSKIYFVILGLSLLVMGFFIYYSWSWLQSIGLPATAAAGYEYHSGVAWPLLWITTVVLLLLANSVLWVTKLSWALWVTFAYFAVMAVVRFFWLEPAYFRFSTANGLAADELSLGPFVAVIMIVIVAAIVFFNQFLIVRMHTKMYPAATDVDRKGSETEIES